MNYVGTMVEEEYIPVKFQVGAETYPIELMRALHAVDPTILCADKYLFDMSNGGLPVLLAKMTPRTANKHFGVDLRFSTGVGCWEIRRGSFKTPSELEGKVSNVSVLSSLDD